MIKQDWNYQLKGTQHENDALKLYSTINYKGGRQQKKKNEDIVFSFKNFIESLQYVM